MHVLLQPALPGRPNREPRLPPPAAAVVPEPVAQPERLRFPRRGDTAAVRQRVLPQPAAGDGPPQLRPGALQRPAVAGHRQPLCLEPDSLLLRFCRHHDEARAARDEDRGRRGDQEGLQIR